MLCSLWSDETSWPHVNASLTDAGSPAVLCSSDLRRRFAGVGLQGSWDRRDQRVYAEHVAAGALLLHRQEVRRRSCRRARWRAARAPLADLLSLAPGHLKLSLQLF